MDLCFCCNGERPRKGSERFAKDLNYYPQFIRKFAHYSNMSWVDFAGSPLRQGSKVSKSGRRKDMTSLLMAERSKQFLNDAQMQKFEEAFYNARRGVETAALHCVSASSWTISKMVATVNNVIIAWYDICVPQVCYIVAKDCGQL